MSDEAVRSWDALRRAGFVRMFEATTTVFTEGEAADGAYVVLQGRFAVLEGDEQVAVIHPGELFGEIGALGGGTRTATVVCLDDGELLFMSLTELRAGFGANPDLFWDSLRLIVGRLRTITARQVAYRDEHKALREVQRSLLPDLAAFDTGGAITVEGVWQPATYASGDFYEVVALDADRTLLAVGDVMGHGAMSSLMMGVARAQLRELARGFRRTDELVLRLDGYLRDNAPPGQGMSLVVAVLDHRDGTLEYSCAGHPMPLLLRDGEVSALPGRGGILLALPFMLGGGYERLVLRLLPGDRLLMFTDGLVEIDTAGGQHLGNEGLGCLLREMAAAAPTGSRGLLDALLAAVAETDVGEIPDDDRTALLLTINDDRPVA